MGPVLCPAYSEVTEVAVADQPQLPQAAMVEMADSQVEAAVAVDAAMRVIHLAREARGPTAW